MPFFSSFIHPYVDPNLYGFISSAEHKSWEKQKSFSTEEIKFDYMMTECLFLGEL